MKELSMMKRRVNVQVPVAILAATFLTVGVSAQQPTPPATPQQPQQSLSGGQMPPVDKYIVGTAKPPAVLGSQMIDLTLEQAVQVALDHNLSLQAAKLNPAMQDYTLDAARAAYSPNLNATYLYKNSSTPSNDTVVGLGNTKTTGTTLNATLSQNTPWYGGSYSFQLNNNRNFSSAANTKFPTSYGASFNLNYTQPLWQNLKIDSNRTNILTNQIQRQIVDISLLATIENTKASVRTAYWSLKAAIERIEINRRALALANQLLDNDKVSVQIGTMAPIDTAQPESSVAQAEGNLLAAQIAWQQAELAFKQLLVTGRDDDLWKKTINPADIPALGQEPTVNIDAAVDRAIADRTDIQTARKQLESTGVSLEQTKNLIHPQLNLTGTLSSSGQGPSVFDTSGNYLTAVGNVWSLDAPTWQIQTQFVYPFGMRSAKANLARSELSFEQAKTNLKATELSVATDVTTAALAVENTYKQYLAAQKAAAAQQLATDAEQTRFSVGLSNNFNVVTQQNSLTSLRLNELTALINYVNALADYDRKQRIGGGGGGAAPVTGGGSTTTGGGGS
jgi:outer membrane protein TolC